MSQETSTSEAHQTVVFNISHLKSMPMASQIQLNSQGSTRSNWDADLEMDGQILTVNMRDNMGLARTLSRSSMKKNKSNGRSLRTPQPKYETKLVLRTIGIGRDQGGSMKLWNKEAILLCSRS